MKNEKSLPEQAEEVLTEDSVKEIETAIEEKIQLSVEAALTNQDELYAEKLEELVTAIDKDHTDKLKRETERYIEEMVKPGRAMGELNQPTTADVDLERGCHMVTELTQEGNIFYGKSKVLSTPCGQVVRSLINDGVKVGMSSRALGTLEEGSDHSTVKNMKLVAIDCVADPSYPSAFVDGILESKQWVVTGDNRYEEIYEDFEKSIKTLPKKEVDSFLRNRILNFIKSL